MLYYPPIWNSEQGRMHHLWLTRWVAWAFILLQDPKELVTPQLHEQDSLADYTVFITQIGRCVCVVIVTRKLKLQWNFATCSYNVHLDNCFFVNIVRLCFFVNTVLACCYGSNDINRNNSGATNLQGFLFFNGKENSKTKNTLFICNYGNTNTRQTQEGCIIGTWEVFYLVVLGKRQSWNGIEVLGCYNLGKRGKNKTKLHSSQKRRYLGGSGSFPDLYHTTLTE